MNKETVEGTPRKSAEELYGEFMKESNIVMMVIPEYKLRDDGTFSTVLKSVIRYKDELDANNTRTSSNKGPQETA